MWLTRKKAKKINSDLEQIKFQVDELKSENSILKHKIVLKDAKIKDQMEGLQHLNRDLDEWLPLATLIASIPIDGDLPIRTPAKGVKLLLKCYS